MVQSYETLSRRTIRLSPNTYETAETGTEKTDRRNVKNRVFTKKSVNVYVIFYPQYTYILIFFIYFCNEKTKT